MEKEKELPVHEHEQKDVYDCEVIHFEKVVNIGFLRDVYATMDSSKNMMKFPYKDRGVLLTAKFYVKEQGVWLTNQLNGEEIFVSVTNFRYYKKIKQAVVTIKEEKDGDSNGKKSKSKKSSEES